MPSPEEEEAASRAPPKEEEATTCACLEGPSRAEEKERDEECHRGRREEGRRHGGRERKR
jgi:hypothetical protein